MKEINQYETPDIKKIPASPESEIYIIPPLLSDAINKGGLYIIGGLFIRNRSDIAATSDR